MELTFKLTIDEANTILRGLGKLPFEDVANLVSKLNMQATPQLEPAETEPVKEE
jgi:hypothetical protein